MSATSRAPDASDRQEPNETGAAGQRYFRAIEDHFIRLRGAPLLLSPADHLVARGWFEASIPLEVVRRALDGLFERRRERGTTRRVSSLRYCRPAVEKEWQQVAQLRAMELRTAAPALNVRGRLEELVAKLPGDLPDRDLWVARIGELRGEAEVVEAGLAELDRTLIESLVDQQTPQEAADVERGVKEALAPVAGRLPAGDLAMARERLRRQLVRRRAALPLLSLFADG